MINTSMYRKLLFFYWLISPILFGTYLFLTATIQKTSIEALLTTIPSLALTSIVSLLMIFQVVCLYLLGNTSDCRYSFFGNFLLFSMGQQLLTLNIIGLILTFLLYQSLLSVKETKEISVQIKKLMYALIYFIGGLSILVVLIRFLT